MYAVQTEAIWSTGACIHNDTKHLVQSIAVSASTSMDRDEDSLGNVTHFADTTTNFIVTSLCSVTFNTDKISMFGDADLCAKCADICNGLPKYVR